MPYISNVIASRITIESYKVNNQLREIYEIYDGNGHTIITI